MLLKESFLVVYVALYFLRAQSNNCTIVDPSDRVGCPSSDGVFSTQSFCLDEGCCWNTSEPSGPNCFFPGYEAVSSCSTSELTTVTMVTISPEEAIERIEELLEIPVDVELEELSEIAEQSLSSTVPSQDGENVVQTLLVAAERVYHARINDSQSPNANLWINFFDNILVFPDLKTEENAKVFLNITTTILINKISNSNTFEVVAPHVIIAKLEEYAVVMASSLLGSADENNLQLNFQNVIMTSCRESATETGCEVANEDVTASIMTPDDRAYVTSLTYDPTLNFNLLPGEHFGRSHARLGSSLFTVTSHGEGGAISNITVEMTFRKLPNLDNNTAICAFILEPDGDWSDSGCSVMSETAVNVSCLCNHNTSFALLFLHSDVQLTAEEERSFELITYIGCGTSITALMLTVFSFLYLRLTHIKRVVLHLNLAITLCLAQIILLVGTGTGTDTPQCKAIAVLLHFFFMASFSWMLMEGILLYFQSVRAVKGEVNFNLMLVFGWVLPLVIVGTSLAAGYDGYGNDRGCWLSINNGLIWAFVGPALGFILMNVLLLGSIVQVFLKLKSNAKTGEWEKAKRTIRAIALLTPLFGITWCFGALAVNDATKWFLYIFSICNSMQGVAIFFLHCLHNHDVRKAFLKKYRRNIQNSLPFFTSVTPTSSGMTSVNSTSGPISTPSMPHKSWN